MSRTNWIELAARYHCLLCELVHHVEHGRIVGPVQGAPKRNVDALLLACFEAAEESPFAPDPDTEDMLREDAAEIKAAIFRVIAAVDEGRGNAP